YHELLNSRSDTIVIKYQYDALGNVIKTTCDKEPTNIFYHSEQLFFNGEYEYDSHSSPFYSWPMELNYFLFRNPGPNNIVKKSLSISGTSPYSISFEYKYNLDGFPERSQTSGNIELFKYF